MKRGVLRHCIVGLTVMLMSAGAGAVTFSLDDNPTAPFNVSSPAGLIPGHGAEQPFGAFAPPRIPAPGMAPSPSLVLPPLGFGDAEIWSSAGVLNVSAPAPIPGAAAHWMDALSNNTPQRGDIRLDFSVDRASHPAWGGGGLPGTAVFGQAALSQQPGDIFRTARQFTAPGTFAGTLPANAGYVGALPTATAVPSNNVLVIDESALGLTAVGVVGAVIPPNAPGAVPLPGQPMHDNVDGFEWSTLDVTGDLTTDQWLYFSINPDATAATGLLASDIFAVAPGAAVGIPFATTPNLGLPLPAGVQPPLLDDVDALVLWDLGTVGQMDPGVDYALFSLSPGSPSLMPPPAPGLNLNHGDVFFTDFNGTFALFADAQDLGLVPSPGGPLGDNVDALEVSDADADIPEPLTVLGSLLGLSGLIGYLRKRRTAKS